MIQKNKKRLLSVFLVLCMLCSIVFNGSPVRAEEESNSNTDVITLDNAPEKEFASWTFSDVGIPNSDRFGTYWDPNTSWTTGNSLDMSIFQGKIKFPTNGAGHFYIGDVDSSSLWRGFRFTNNGTDKLDFAFVGTNDQLYNENGATGKLLATFDPEIAGTTLIENKELEVAVSFEYTNVADGKVTMKVGVFFNRRLYNNTYLTVKDVPEAFLTQTIRFSNPGNDIKWAATSIITLDSAPENEFAHWTFSDVGIPNSDSFGTYWDPKTSWTTGKELNKTIFQGKINFPTNGTGHFYIGDVEQIPNSDPGLWRGFRFTSNGTEKLDFAFVGNSGATTSIATFDKGTAGTTLRGNKNLEVAVSFEYTSVTDTTATLKVGVFFDGKLYNGTYYTVSNVPKSYLTQTIRFSNPGSEKWAAASIATLATAPENKFTHWTFSDVNIPDSDSFGTYWDPKTSWTTGKELNKTIFQGKINFPTNGTGHFYIGDVEQIPNSDPGLWRGFRFTSNGTEKLDFAFVGNSGATTSIATFDKGTAGTTLRGNKNLEVAVSFEYTSVTDTTATLKVGVFFDGKLYNGTYYTVSNVPKSYLTQTIRFSNPGTGVKWAAASIKITLGTALENKFTRWTFSDVNIPDGSFGDRWSDNDVVKHTTEKSLNKTLFQGKMKFPTVCKTDTVDHYTDFVIGKKVGESKYEGFRFHSSSDGKLSLQFTKNDGKDTSTLVTFDPEIARATLIGNEDLDVAFSIEYTSIKDGLVTMKVGVFFDGRLYNDMYLTVKDVPEAYLKQAIRFKNTTVNTDVADKWYAESMEDFEVIVQPEITDSIAMNYMVTIDPYILESGEPSITFAMNENKTDAIVGVEVWDNTYKFTYPDIMAQNIADTITATLTIGGETRTYEYSVLDYCVAVVKANTLTHVSGAAYSAEQMEALKELVVDLVEYGAEVQKYRNSSIADADLVTTKFGNQVANYTSYDTADTDLTNLPGVVTEKLTGDDTTAAYKWKSATLVLGNKVKIRCKFTAENVENLTIKSSMGDVDFYETNESGVYAVEIDNIYANEYAEKIEIEFYEGETAVGQKLNYSVNTYLDAKKNADSKDLLSAIHNYGEAADAYVKANELRVLITSDLHFTSLEGDWGRFLMTLDERAQKWVDAIKKEHETEPLDLIVINGDISLDHWQGYGDTSGAYYDDQKGESADIIQKYFSDLPTGVPVVVMPGNHEQYSNADWKAIAGTERQGFMVLNNSLFLFLDNYKVEETATEPSDGTYTQTDVAYIKEMMNQYPSCDVYLISHMFEMGQESTEFKTLVANNDRIKGLFEGHTHNAATLTPEGLGGKTIAQTGSFAHLDNDGDSFWGFRELVIKQDSAYSNFIQFKSSDTGTTNENVADHTRTYYISYPQTDEK